MTNPTEDGRQDCMVERVARALFGSWVANWGHIGEPECTNWDELDAHGREFGLKQARDAIESMREDDLANLLAERKFDSRTTRDGQSECVLWTGAVSAKDGYGRFYRGGGETVFAHQFAYVRAYGSVPAGLVIDHVCRNRRCVNHLHLRIVTNAENVLTGVGITAKNATKTHCIHGHELSGDNLYVRPDGFRGCKTCIRDADNRRKLRARGAAFGGSPNPTEERGGE